MAPPTSYPALDGDLEFDAAVIGLDRAAGSWMDLLAASAAARDEGAVGARRGTVGR